jgi:hypothetical protein
MDLLTHRVQAALVVKQAWAALQMMELMQNLQKLLIRLIQLQMCRLFPPIGNQFQHSVGDVASVAVADLRHWSQMTLTETTEVPEVPDTRGLYGYMIYDI